jgi:hypothetical protein
MVYVKIQLKNVILSEGWIVIRRNNVNVLCVGDDSYDGKGLGSICLTLDARKMYRFHLQITLDSRICSSVSAVAAGCSPSSCE